jgi:hypothetical protein
MMAIQRDDDELPAPIAEALVDVGLSPEISVLMNLIESFPRLQAEARATPSATQGVIEQWPLKFLLPSHIAYETARKCAERGELHAQKVGGRWFSCAGNIEMWLRTTGRWFKTEAEERKWRTQTRRF